MLRDSHGGWGSLGRDDEDVEQQERERHRTGRTVDAAVRVQTKAQHVGQEAQVGTGEEGDHVGQRQVPGSKTSFRQCGNSKGQTKSVDRDIGQLDEDTASTPRTQKSMTAKKVWISEVLGCEKRDPFPHRPWQDVDDDEGKEEAACGCSVNLGDIHEGRIESGDDRWRSLEEKWREGKRRGQ